MCVSQAKAKDEYQYCTAIYTAFVFQSNWNGGRLGRRGCFGCSGGQYGRKPRALRGIVASSAPAFRPLYCVWAPWHGPAKVSARAQAFAQNVKYGTSRRTLEAVVIYLPWHASTIADRTGYGNFFAQSVSKSWDWADRRKDIGTDRGPSENKKKPSAWLRWKTHTGSLKPMAKGNMPAMS